MIRTFAEARRAILADLASRGWSVSAGLKTPHATSPDGRARLWFKPQAVWFSRGAGTNLGQAHSLWMDIRVASTDQVLAAIAGSVAVPVAGCNCPCHIGDRAAATHADVCWCEDERVNPYGYEKSKVVAIRKLGAAATSKGFMAGSVQFDPNTGPDSARWLSDGSSVEGPGWITNTLDETELTEKDYKAWLLRKAAHGNKQAAKLVEMAMGPNPCGRRRHRNPLLAIVGAPAGNPPGALSVSQVGASAPGLVIAKSRRKARLAAQAAADPSYHPLTGFGRAHMAWLRRRLAEITRQRTVQDTPALKDEAFQIIAALARLNPPERARPRMRASTPIVRCPGCKAARLIVPDLCPKCGMTISGWFAKNPHVNPPWLAAKYGRSAERWWEEAKQAAAQRFPWGTPRFWAYTHGIVKKRAKFASRRQNPMLALVGGPNPCRHTRCRRANPGGLGECLLSGAVGGIAAAMAGHAMRRRSNPTDHARGGDRGYKRSISIGEAVQLAQAKSPQFQRAFRAAIERYKKFHGIYPATVSFYEYANGRQDLTETPVAVAGPAPELHYLGPDGAGPMGKSSKANTHWVHKTSRRSPPWLAVDPVTNTFRVFGGATKMSSWLFD